MYRQYDDKRLKVADRIADHAGLLPQDRRCNGLHKRGYCRWEMCLAGADLIVNGYFEKPLKKENL